jgi:hypothetical protein
MAAVIKQFNLKPDDYSYLSIETRESGIISFLLNLLKLDPTVKMVCNNDCIEFEQSSLKGSIKQVIPLNACTEIVTAIHKPILLFAAAVVFVLLSLFLLVQTIANDVPFALCVVSLLVAIACAVFYFLKKTILFAVKNGGDSYAAAIYAQPAVIAGERIDNEKFTEAANILRDKINKAANKSIA